AGFTSEGLPIGVQLMGPANSEPLLISLAAELEGLSGWAAKQPEVWGNTGTDTPPISSRPQLRGELIFSSKSKPTKLYGVALPILGDLDAQVEVDLGTQQLLDLAARRGAYLAQSG